MLLPTLATCTLGFGAFALYIDAVELLARESVEPTATDFGSPSNLQSAAVMVTCEGLPDPCLSSPHAAR